MIFRENPALGSKDIYGAPHLPSRSQPGCVPQHAAKSRALDQEATATQPGAGRTSLPDSTRRSTISAGIGQLNQLRTSRSGATTAARSPASNVTARGSSGSEV